MLFGQALPHPQVNSKQSKPSQAMVVEGDIILLILMFMFLMRKQLIA
jgi:hypothetical protein